MTQVKNDMQLIIIVQLLNIILGRMCFGYQTLVQLTNCVILID